MTHRIESLRRAAKAMTRETSIPHQKALDVIANRYGYSHWGALVNDPAPRALPADPVAMRSVIAVKGASIAALAEAVLHVFARTAHASRPPVHDDELFDPTNAIEVRTDGTTSQCGMTHDQAHVLEDIREELVRMSDAVSPTARFRLRVGREDDCWSAATLELVHPGGQVWISCQQDGRIMHLLAREGMAMRNLPENTPEGWQAAAKWVTGCHSNDDGNRLDPVDWGFRPCGLLPGPEWMGDSTVVGCLYEADHEAHVIEETTSSLLRNAGTAI